MQGLAQIEVARATGDLAFGIASKYHISTRGTRLSFDRHRCLVPIYKDQHPNICCIKSGQVGFTTLLECRTFAYVIDGWTVFYTLPDLTIRNLYVESRVNPTLGSCDLYRALVHEATERLVAGKSAADAVSIKQLGKGHVIYAGSNAKAAFRLHSADVMIIDEYDDCDQVNILKAPGRLHASPLKHMIETGNPTISGYGVDALYGNSDKREWRIPCPSCGVRQTLSWEQHIVREVDDGVYALRSTGERSDVRDTDAKIGLEPDVLCRDCEQPMDRHAPGEWIAEHPDRSKHGYHISQLFCGSETIRDMWAEFVKAQNDESKLTVFVNLRLGKARESKGQKLSTELLRGIIGDYGKKSRCEEGFMGVDQGKALHWVVMDIDKKVIAVGIILGRNPFTQLPGLMDQYNASCVLDAGPERHAAQEFASEYAGRVWLCEFLQDDKGGDYTFREDEDLVFVKPDRTQFMDATHAAILRNEIQLYRTALSEPDFDEQMCAPVRVLREFRRKSGVIVRRYVWDEGSKADHYRFAFGYSHLCWRVMNEDSEPNMGMA